MMCLDLTQCDVLSTLSGDDMQLTGSGETMQNAYYLLLNSCGKASTLVT